MENFNFYAMKVKPLVYNLILLNLEYEELFSDLLLRYVYLNVPFGLWHSIDVVYMT